MDFNRYIQVFFERYSVIATRVKSNNKLCGVEVEDLTNITFKELREDLPNTFENGDLEEAFLIILKNEKQGLTIEDVKREKNVNKLQFYFWVKEQYKKIEELENKYLSSTPDPHSVAAGIDKFNVLGDFNTVDSIARNYGYTHEQAWNLKYSTIFNILLREKLEADFNKKYNELIKNKAL